MINVTVDLEFTNFTRDADVISIGMVAEDGHQLHIVISDVDWHKASVWVMENVEPLLALPQFAAVTEVMPCEAVSERMASWFASVRGGLDSEIRLIATSEWDWRLLVYRVWPKDFAVAQRLRFLQVPQMLLDDWQRIRFDGAFERYFGNSKWAQLEHHALVDARAAMAAYRHARSME